MVGRVETHLIELLLPLRDNDGRPYEQQLFNDVSESLAEKFGGVTAFMRAPAKGVWITGDQKERDDVIVVEVMADSLDRNWWLGFRQRLEIVMRQSEIVVRSQAIERL